MRKCLLALWYFCRHAIVSLEFLFCIVSVCLYRYCYCVRDIMANSNIGEEIKILLITITIGVSVWIFAEVQKILWPEVENRAVLKEWPDYARLRCCCFVACAYAFGSSALSIASGVLYDSLPKGVALYCLMSSIIIVLIDAASCWLASLEIRQIIECLATTKTGEIK